MTVPIQLSDNRVPVYYEGGQAIDRFRGKVSSQCTPEDWIGSTTSLPEGLLPDGVLPSSGISPLPDGRLLRDVISEDPVSWLGERHVARFGSNPALLVKLLDAGERLPLHAHPDRSFAQRHLDSFFGKTEAWIVLDAEPNAYVGLGFKERIERDTLRSMVDTQDISRLLALMQTFTAHAGDVFFVPAGVPHTIGPGVLILELQEPTSLSILLEHEAFGLSHDQATLGLGWDTAIELFDYEVYDGPRLASLRPERRPIHKDAHHVLEELLPSVASPFFGARRLLLNGAARLDLETLAILVVDRGAARLHGRDYEFELSAGQTWIIPQNTGTVSVNGAASILICTPPHIK